MGDELIEDLWIQCAGNGLLHVRIASEFLGESFCGCIEVVAWEGFPWSVFHFGVISQDGAFYLIGESTGWLSHHATDEIENGSGEG